MSVNITKQTAPSAEANYNKLFTKTNGDLAWVDESNAEHIVGSATTDSNIFYGVQSSVAQTITSSGGIATLDLSLSNSYVLTLTENTTLSNPTNLPGGFVGVNILVIQDATTPYTLTLDTAYSTLDGTPITVSTTLGAENLLTLQVTSGSVVWASLATGGVA